MGLQFKRIHKYGNEIPKIINKPRFQKKDHYKNIIARQYKFSKNMTLKSLTCDEERFGAVYKVEPWNK